MDTLGMLNTIRSVRRAAGDGRQVAAGGIASEVKASRLLSRQWYRKRMREGFCCGCSRKAAVQNIMQDGKVVESRVMAHCYDCKLKARNRERKRGGRRLNAQAVRPSRVEVRASARFRPTAGEPPVSAR